MTARLFPILALSLYLYGPRLSIIDLHALSVALLSVVGASLCLSPLYRPKAVEFFLLALLLQAAYTLTLFIVCTPSDDTGLWITFKELLYLFSSIAIIHLYYTFYKQGTLSTITQHLVILSAANSIFVIATVISPSFRSFAFAVLYTDGKEAWLNEGYRGLDVSIGGGTTASIAFVLATSALYWRMWNKVASTFEVYALLPILFLGTFLTARSGTFLFVLLSGLYGTAWLVRTNKAIGIKTIATVLVVASFAYLSVLSAVDSALYGHFANTVLPWALELIFYGSTRSTDALSGMYFMPAFADDALFGVSNYGRSQVCPYVPSDVGYVLLIFGSGILGVLLILGKYIFLAFYNIKAGQAHIRIAVISIICIGLLKEQVVSSRGVWAITLVLLLASHAVGHRDQKNIPRSEIAT